MYCYIKHIPKSHVLRYMLGAQVRVPKLLVLGTSGVSAKVPCLTEKQYLGIMHILVPILTYTTSIEARQDKINSR